MSNSKSQRIRLSASSGGRKEHGALSSRRQMEESLPRLRRTLASFCDRLESSCDALKLSIDRRAVPLDSASTTFIHSLNRRVSSLSGDLNLLETMSLDMVSFEELLGHCNEVFKKNQSVLVELRDRLHLLGHISAESEIDILQEGCLASSNILEVENAGPDQGPIMRNLADDSLLEELTSLQSLGLSDASLATIASEGSARIDELDSGLHNLVNQCNDESLGYGDQNLKAAKSGDTNETKSVEAVRPIIHVSKDDYESLPSYMKSLASWEDLHIAIEKMNSSISKKGNTKETAFFHPDELEPMGLGPKARSYVLLLVRMKQLVVETKDGSISYRVL